MNEFKVGDLVVFPGVANCSGIIKKIDNVFDLYFIEVHEVDKPPKKDWFKKGDFKLYECEECKKGFEDV